MRLALALTLATTTALAQTPAALTEQVAFCKNNQPYPAMPPPPASLMPVTKGKQQIDQVRGGKVVAIYSTFADGPKCNIPGDGAWV